MSAGMERAAKWSLVVVPPKKTHFWEAKKHWKEIGGKKGKNTSFSRFLQYLKA